MDPASVPLTWSAALTHWQWDTGAGLAVVVLGIGYGWVWRRGARDVLTAKHALCFAVGIVLFAAALRVMLLLIGFGYSRARLQAAPVFAADLACHQHRRFDRRRLVGHDVVLGPLIDAELEIAEAPSGLWWEHDPQLRDRMGRR
jgi:hypothetical protein